MSYPRHKFHEITIVQAREQASKWQKDGRNWHFHALFPKCLLNVQSNRHMLIMEDSSSHMAYAIYSDRGFIELSQEFLKLQYGEDILRRPVKGAAQKTLAHQLLNQVDIFNRTSVPWHHHILLPGCIFNEHPDKWTIILEGGEGQHTFYELYEEEPREVLQLLEIEYFKELDSTFCQERQREDS